MAGEIFMEKLFKLRVFGSEIYSVKDIHVDCGHHVVKGQKLATISSSNMTLEVVADADFVITDVLIHRGDHVKASNVFFRIFDQEAVFEYVERKAVGY
jgi:biotin carboxyl carrier protein